MKYNIKAIPTTYAGVNFRSRLEARWAAFFDLCGWDWDYEPFDLEGWAPDFQIKRGAISAIVEVKPIDLSAVDWDRREGLEVVRDAYRKTKPHWEDYQVLLLGIGPMPEPVAGQIYVVGFTFGVPRYATYTLGELVDELVIDNAINTWREAGSVVQWKRPSYSDVEFIRACAAKHKAAA